MNAIIIISFFILIVIIIVLIYLLIKCTNDKLSNIKIISKCKNETDNGETNDTETDTNVDNNETINPDNNKYKINVPVTDGLIAYYDSTSYSNNTLIWKDLSGNKNDIVQIIDINKDKKYPYVSGTKNSGILFPFELSINYTIIYLAQFKNSTTGRILQSSIISPHEWFSGFDTIGSGVAYHNNWITDQKDVFDNQWVLSVDQQNLYKGNGVNLTTKNGTMIDSFKIGIGKFGFEPQKSADWNISCMIIYDKILTSNEIETIEKYIYKKYGNLLP